MFCLILLILLSVALISALVRLLNKRLAGRLIESRRLKEQYRGLSTENKQLKADSLKYQEDFESTVVLYDLIKELCKSFDEDKIFGVFKESLDRYTKVGDCRFIKSSKALADLRDYTIMSLLAADNQTLGYLAVEKAKGAEAERFAILAQQFIIALRRAALYRKLQELAITDTLTQVYSRRYFLDRFSEELKRSGEYGLKFSFLMLDIDNFKHYNDRYGHLVGDAILRQVSAVIRQVIREIDFVGRYGGDEVCVVLVETNRSQAEAAAERIRQAIELSDIKVYDEEFKVTVAIGVAVFPDNSSQEQKLLEMADQALYAAKGSGKNRVCFYAN